MRRLPLAFVALAMVASTASCLSPTLPLPPPDQPDAILQDSTGLWQISGTCIAGATVAVFDTVTHKGVLAQDFDNTGTYHVALVGQACDVVEITQTLADGEESPPTEIVLEGFVNGEPTGTPCP
jgi:Bacterial Ig domain